MFDAQVFVNKVREGIANDRLNAVWFKVVGHVVKFVGLAVFITGLIQCFALAPPEVRNAPIIGIFCTLVVQVWFWLDAIIPPVWWFLRSISPYPTLTLPLTMPSSLLSGAGIGWLVLSFGLMLLGIKLLQRSTFHSLRAFEEEKVLIHQAPLLLQMYSMRSNQNIDISGDGNVVNAVNQINNIRENDEKGWWTKPMGLIVVGVLISIISKFLGAS